MKKLNLLCILILTITIFSCGSDDDENPTDNISKEETNEITNEFIFNEKKHPMPYGIKSISNTHYQLTFASEDFTDSNYTGTINFVGVLFQSVDKQILPGTYTFLLDTDPNYDASKHFFDAESGEGLKFTNGDADTSSGYYEGMKSGTITIAKENTTYKITYSLNFTGGTFEGEYNGKIKNSEEIQTPPSIMGKWELIELSENGVKEKIQCPNNDTLEFLENNQATSIVYREGRLDNNSEVFRVCVENPTPDNMTWSLNENTITFDLGGGDIFEGQITELNASRLVIKSTYQDKGITNEDIEIYQRVQTD